MSTIKTMLKNNPHLETGIIIAFVFCTLWGFLLTGCDQGNSQENSVAVVSNDDPSRPANAIMTGPKQNGKASQSGVAPGNISQSGVVDFGSGVYYFPSTRARFANELAAFLSVNKELEVTAMAPDIIRMDCEHPATTGGSKWDWGGIAGYFVTFKEKDLK